MLPSLLAICGLIEQTAFRISSVTIAIVMVCYGATYVKRRRTMMAERLPHTRWVPIVTVSALVVLALIGNAVGIHFQPALGPIAVAASWTLGCGAMIFLLALKAFLSDSTMH